MKWTAKCCYKAVTSFIRIRRKKRVKKEHYIKSEWNPSNVNLLKIFLTSFCKMDPLHPFYSNLIHNTSYSNNMNLLMSSPMSSCVRELTRLLPVGVGDCDNVVAVLQWREIHAVLVLTNGSRAVNTCDNQVLRILPFQGYILCIVI